jgi:hypothetical protein
MDRSRRGAFVDGLGDGEFGAQPHRHSAQPLMMNCRIGFSQGTGYAN